MAEIREVQRCQEGMAKVGKGCNVAGGGGDWNEAGLVEWTSAVSVPPSQI